MVSLTNKYLISVPKEFYGNERFVKFIADSLKVTLSEKFRFLALSTSYIPFVCYNVDIPSKVQHSYIEKRMVDRVNVFTESNNEEDLSENGEEQKLSPLVDDYVRYEFNLIEIIPEIINMISFYKDYRVNHVGIQTDMMFRDTLLPTYILMKNIDFGNFDFSPLNFFYPVFQDYEDNIGTLYNNFVKDFQEMREYAKQVERGIDS